MEERYARVWSDYGGAISGYFGFPGLCQVPEELMGYGIPATESGAPN